MRYTAAPSRRWSACRKSLDNASARSIVCTSTRSSTAIWCATLRPGTPAGFASPLACLAVRTQKPENILISSLTDCKVKVIDYGNAYLHHDQRCSYVQSRAYRAPEVVLGLAYSPKVDMWSLGCILMELFTGKLLFDNRSVQARRLHMPALRMLCCLCSSSAPPLPIAGVARLPHCASWAVPREHVTERPALPPLLRHDTVRLLPCC